MIWDLSIMHVSHTHTHTPIFLRRWKIKMKQWVAQDNTALKWYFWDYNLSILMASPMCFSLLHDASFRSSCQESPIASPANRPAIYPSQQTGCLLQSCVVAWNVTAATTRKMPYESAKSNRRQMGRFLHVRAHSQWMPQVCRVLLSDKPTDC